MTDVLRFAELLEQCVSRLGRVKERDDLRQDIWMRLLETPEPNESEDVFQYVEAVIVDEIKQRNKQYGRERWSIVSYRDDGDTYLV